MPNYREILRLHSQGISQRNIAKLCECSRNTVSSALKRASINNISYPLPTDMSDVKLKQLLFPKEEAQSKYKMPDYEYVHKELSKPGVTLTLLWQEYCEQCRLARELPFMYTQFGKYYRNFAQTSKATMHINRKPGEILEVDWAGQTAELTNSVTGEILKAYIFVATLPSSKYSYVEAFLSMEIESWITGHVNAYRYFGGSTKMLVPDNLKTGVIKAHKYDPIINKTYQDMACHYNTVVMPTRVRKPKDKASVEGEVGVVSTKILAAIRHQHFFSLKELNEAIRIKLEAYNLAPFQKRAGGRLSVFLEEEKAFLIPLPPTPFEISTWKVATVQFNYHITVDKMNYSVPYEYIKQKVDVRTTKTIVEVFYKNTRIASHARCYGATGQYKTNLEHMPQSHQVYAQWNAARFINWAKSIGQYTEAVIRYILDNKKVEQQAYKACMAVLKLADKYSQPRLEAACSKVLEYTAKPSYKNIQLILQNGKEKTKQEDLLQEDIETQQAGFTRGSSYYGGQ